jgi:DnaK suppressor protein
MKEADLNRYQSALMGLRDVLNGAAKPKLEPNRSAEAERPDDDYQALNEMHQSIASGRNKNRSVLMLQINDALEMIAEEPEEYGVCEDCGDAIPKGRLDLMPYVVCCVGCQSKREDGGSQAGRRKLTDYIG